MSEQRPLADNTSPNGAASRITTGGVFLVLALLVGIAGAALLAVDRRTSTSLLTAGYFALAIAVLFLAWDLGSKRGSHPPLVQAGFCILLALFPAALLGVVLTGYAVETLGASASSTAGRPETRPTCLSEEFAATQAKRNPKTTIFITVSSVNPAQDIVEAEGFHLSPHAGLCAILLFQYPGAADSALKRTQLGRSAALPSGASPRSANERPRSWSGARRSATAMIRANKISAPPVSCPT
jgi:hypothetical protein